MVSKPLFWTFTIALGVYLSLILFLSGALILHRILTGKAWTYFVIVGMQAWIAYWCRQQHLPERSRSTR